VLRGRAKLTTWTSHRLLVLAMMLAVAASSRRPVTGPADTSVAVPVVTLSPAIPSTRRAARSVRSAWVGPGRLFPGPDWPRQRGRGCVTNVQSASPRLHDHQLVNVLSPALTVERQVRLYGLPKR
jgi:hypothetical protein